VNYKRQYAAVNNLDALRWILDPFLYGSLVFSNVLVLEMDSKMKLFVSSLPPPIKI